MDIKSASKAHAVIYKFGYEKDPSLVSSLISTYASCGFVNIASKLLEESLDCCFSDLEACNVGISSFTKSGHLDFARKVFVKMPDRDLVSWNSLISGCVKNGRFSEALRLSKDMISANVDPDEFTFASLAAACARLGAHHHAEWQHGLLVERKFPLNQILHAAFVTCMQNVGGLNYLKKSFEVPSTCAFLLGMR